MVNIQKDLEKPWFCGKWSTNGGFSTSIFVYRRVAQFFLLPNIAKWIDDET